MHRRWRALGFALFGIAATSIPGAVHARSRAVSELRLTAIPTGSEQLAGLPVWLGVELVWEGEAPLVIAVTDVEQPFHVALEAVAAEAAGDAGSTSGVGPAEERGSLTIAPGRDAPEAARHLRLEPDVPQLWWFDLEDLARRSADPGASDGRRGEGFERGPGGARRARGRRGVARTPSISVGRWRVQVRLRAQAQESPAAKDAAPPLEAASAWIPLRLYAREVASRPAAEAAEKVDPLPAGLARIARACTALARSGLPVSERCAAAKELGLARAQQAANLLLLACTPPPLPPGAPGAQPKADRSLLVEAATEALDRLGGIAPHACVQRIPGCASARGRARIRDILVRSVGPEGARTLLTIARDRRAGRTGSVRLGEVLDSLPPPVRRGPPGDPDDGGAAGGAGVPESATSACPSPSDHPGWPLRGS